MHLGHVTWRSVKVADLVNLSILMGVFFFKSFVGDLPRRSVSKSTRSTWLFHPQLLCLEGIFTVISPALSTSSICVQEDSRGFSLR